MASLPSIPGELASADVASGVVRLTVREELYPLDAVFAAAFTFIKDCWVVVDRADAAHWAIALTPKAAGADAALLEQWVGGFANELLACAYRHRLAKDHRATVEAVTTAAMAGALGPPSLDLPPPPGRRARVSSPTSRATSSCSPATSSPLRHRHRARHQRPLLHRRLSRRQLPARHYDVRKRRRASSRPAAASSTPAPTCTSSSSPCAATRPASTATPRAPTWTPCTPT
jgi:His-Xaa-Ser system protein HxsD